MLDLPGNLVRSQIVVQIGATHELTEDRGGAIGAWNKLVAQGELPRDDRLDAESPVRKFADNGRRISGARNQGKNVTSATRYKTRLEKIGFKNVAQVNYSALISPWIQEPEARKLGELCQRVLLQLIRPFTIMTIVAGGLWTMEEMDEKLVDVRKELMNTDIHAWIPM